MSSRLVIAIAWATIIGAGVVTWILVQPDPAPPSGSGSTTTQPAPETERREYQQKLFGGDTSRDIRSGQEMKPRW